MNWNDYGARYYDAATAKFGQIDPLADHPNQIDKSVYAYAWNNPIKLNDPDGRCPACWGAVIDGGVEIVSQMVSNAATGNNILNFDYYDIWQSTWMGAASGGLSVLKSGARLTKTIITIADEAGKAGTDIKLSKDGDVIVESVANRKKKVSDAVVETTASVFGAKTGEFLGDAAGNIVNKELAKEAKDAGRRARGAMTGSANQAAAVATKASIEATMRGNAEVANQSFSVLIDQAKQPVIDWTNARVQE